MTIIDIPHTGTPAGEPEPDPARAQLPAEPLDRRASSDTSFDLRLDEEPEPSRAPVYVDVVSRDDHRRPIVPASLRGRTNIVATVKRQTALVGHHAGYHALRAPWYALLTALWSVVGVFRLTGRQLRWWWHPELSGMLQQAATKGELKEGSALEKQLSRRRSARGFWLLAELLALAVAVPSLVFVAPGWVLAVALVAAVPGLARIGRPTDRPIISTAVVTPRVRRMNADVVLRAYYAAGLGHPDKSGQQITFATRMTKDGDGSSVTVDLPFGKGLDDAVKAKSAIASGLDVVLSQVYIDRDPTSHRRHVLWVADRDPLAIGAGRTPLLACKPTDIWQPAPFGLNERGEKVSIGLMWNSVLIGAQPRQGKTFSARQLALYAALDPHVKLSVFDGKGSPDWRKFSLVADRYAFGLTMTRDGDPVEIFLQTLRDLKADVQDRYQRLSELPASICPEGKLTREIARNPKYKMPVRLVVIDEFQEYFDLGDDSKEIAALLMFLVKVAPAAGVMVIDATQKPSLPGTGPLSQAFNNIRDNHVIRFSLRTGSYNVSDLVLGAGAYSEGLDSSELLPSYKGVGILRGASDDSPTVRTYLADQEDAEKILIAARALRQRAGTLSGMAVGEVVETVEVRDTLADVRAIFATGERGLHWDTVAARLASAFPNVYGDATGDMIREAVKPFGVTTGNVKVAGVNRNGTRLDQIEAAMARRAIER